MIGALPDEKVLIQDGRLQIDGKFLDNAGILSEARFAANELGGKFGIAKTKDYTNVPANRYYILSDGSGGTPDSRVFGWVAHGRIVGVASRVWWPLRAARRLGPK